MPSFVVLQQSASQLPQRLSKNLESSFCVSLFKLDSTKLMSACTAISQLAKALDDDYDETLIDYLQSKQVHLLTLDELEQFKIQVLKGGYFLKWLTFYAQTTNFSNQSLLSLFESDIENPLNAISKSDINSCLDDFGRFCSYAYLHLKEEVYKKLLTELGDTVQVDIHNIKNSSIKSSWPNTIYTGLSTLWAMK